VLKAGPRPAISCSVIGFPPEDKSIGFQKTCAVLLSFAVEPSLRLGFGLIRRAALRNLGAYGVWLFIMSVMRLIVGQINPVLIGARLSIQLVTPYSIAVRLMGYAVAVLITGTNVLTPVATTLHAQGSEEAKRKLFVLGGVYCALMGLFFLTLFVFLGRAFIRLWMGPALEQAAALLVILAAGEALSMSQWVTYSMILGVGRHRFLAGVSMLEAGLVVAGTFALLGPFGLAGACTAVAVPAVLCRGVIQLVYGCRVVQVPVAAYCYRALLRPLLSALPQALLLGLLTRWRQPRSWFELVAFGAVYAFTYLLTWLIFFDPEPVKGLRARFLSPRVGAAGPELVSAKS
jgi:O-antigen/teichoic acid export membrane protein